MIDFTTVYMRKRKATSIKKKSSCEIKLSFQKCKKMEMLDLDCSDNKTISHTQKKKKRTQNLTFLDLLVQNYNYS